MGELEEISRKRSITDIYPVFNRYQYSAEHPTTQKDGYHDYSHFRFEETEAQKGVRIVPITQLIKIKIRSPHPTSHSS